MIYIGFRFTFAELRNSEAGFPILVTDNEQDLTPCYPQKDGITVKTPLLFQFTALTCDENRIFTQIVPNLLA